MALYDLVEYVVCTSQALPARLITVDWNLEEINEVIFFISRKANWGTGIMSDDFLVQGCDFSFLFPTLRISFVFFKIIAVASY